MWPEAGLEAGSPQGPHFAGDFVGPMQGLGLFPKDREKLSGFLSGGCSELIDTELGGIQGAQEGGSWQQRHEGGGTARAWSKLEVLGRAARG